MRAHVNGEPLEVQDGTTLAELVDDLTGDATAGGLAVARNRSVVPRESWNDIVVCEGDRIEVIRSVQGG